MSLHVGNLMILVFQAECSSRRTNCSLVYYAYGWSVPNGAVTWISPPLLIVAARIRIMASVRVGLVLENDDGAGFSQKCLRLSPVSIIPPMPQNHLNFQSFSYKVDKRAKRRHLPTIKMFLRKHRETHLTPEPVRKL